MPRRMSHRTVIALIPPAVILLAALLLAIFTPSKAHGQNAGTYADVTGVENDAVFENVFAGITTPQESAPLTNLGQGMHLVEITFPTAVAPVNPINVQFQYSRDGQEWRGIGGNILTVPVKTQGVGANQAIAYKAYYGTFPAIRIVNLANTPGALPMTVRYIGYLYPVWDMVTERPDRWSFGYAQ